MGHFEWCDDFAAARNAALDPGRRRLEHRVDADEWIAEAGVELLALRHTRPDFVGTLRVDSEFDTPIGGSVCAQLAAARAAARRALRQATCTSRPVHKLPRRRLPPCSAHDGYLSEA